MSWGTRKIRKATALWPMRLAIISLFASLPLASYAENLPVPNPDQQATPVDPIADYFAHWFDRVDAAQASQPHWMTPITTVTPRLEEEYRRPKSTIPAKWRRG
jgi:hypothetical protein